MKTTLSSAQKVAIVLLQLGQERAAKVLAQLSETEVEEVTAEIVRMEDVPEATTTAVVREFHTQLIGGEPAPGHGGMDFAQRLLEASLGAEKAAGVMGRLSTLLAGQPFDFLQQADARQVQSLVSGEHPQTMALVLAHLRADRASAIMAGLAPELRADVALRIARMERATPEAVAIVADNLQRKATTVLTPGSSMAAVGGVQPLVDILNRSDPGTEKQILEALGARDGDLAEEVRGLMFTFEDVVLLDDRAVQLVMRQIDIAALAVALKGAPLPVAEKIERNLSERARETLSEESDVAGRVRLSEVQEARGSVVNVIRTLEESGQIVIRRESEDDYVA